MLGLSNNQSLNKLVLTENQIHTDLIQSNFIDSYQNLSYKSIKLNNFQGRFSCVFECVDNRSKKKNFLLF